MKDFWKYLRRCRFAIPVLLMMGCSSINCPLNNTVYTQYELKQARYDASKQLKILPDTLRDTLSIVTERYDQMDSVLINRQVNATNLKLPISFTADEDVLYFLRKGKGDYIVDEVRIKKTNTPHFESVECSPNYFHEIVSVETTHNGIDSIVVKDKTVDYNARTNFYIYFKH